SNADILGLFTSGKLEGAWVPEPWGARLIWQGGGHILVDERDLWPDRTFHTTLLVTTTDFLKTRADDTRAMLKAHLELTRRWREQPARFAEKANDAFGRLTGKPLSAKVLQDAFSRLEPAVHPLPQVLSLAAMHSYELGFARSADVSGIVDTTLLNEALVGSGLGSGHQNKCARNPQGCILPGGAQTPLTERCSHDACIPLDSGGGLACKLCHRQERWKQPEGSSPHRFNAKRSACARPKPADS